MVTTVSAVPALALLLCVKSCCNHGHATRRMLLILLFRCCFRRRSEKCLLFCTLGLSHCLMVFKLLSSLFIIKILVILLVADLLLTLTTFINDFRRIFQKFCLD